MRGNETKNQFWLVLGALNVLAMIYPIVLVYRADQIDAKLLAAVVLVVAILLLAVGDAVSIVIADVVGGGKQGDKRIKTHSN
jgi:hypothetical protein